MKKMAKAKTSRKSPVVGRSGGKDVTEEDLDRIVREAEAGYDVDEILRRRGRPPMGSGPADVVPVRLDPELREAVETRAVKDDATTSEVIRRALRRYLGVA
jgi:hypothetical protein